MSIKSNRTKKIVLIALLFALAAFIYFIVAQKDNTGEHKSITESVGPAPVQNTIQNKPEVNQAVPPAATSQEEKAVIPNQYSLAIPFASQAPFGVWDPLHEDACEEASLLMVQYYRKKVNTIAPSEADNEIRKLVSFEDSVNLGPSITISELNLVAKQYYNLETGRVVLNPTPQNIREEIAAGKPVIIPAAGKLLGNPNFRNGGPIYHMLVVKGYDKNGFITNDPGTRNGLNYYYKTETLTNAIHDWNPDNITNGQKAYLVFD